MIARTASAIAVLLAASLLAACSDDSPAGLLKAAQAAVAKHDEKTAIIQIKNALQADPNFAEARYLLGVTLLGQGDVNAAEVELRKALALGYSPDLAVPKLAAALLAQGNFKKLTDEFSTAALKSAASTADLQTSLAYAFAMQGNKELSAAAMKTALAADPEFVPTRIAEARFLAGAGDAQGALAHVDDILKRNPRSAEAWRLRGDIQTYLESRPDPALADYRKALDIDPNFVAAHLAIIAILVDKRQVDDAGKQLALLRKVTGNTAQAMYIEAMIDYLRKDTTEARKIAQQLLKVAPNSPAILLLAGGIEMQDGSLALAQTYLEHAVQLASQAPVARRMLITTYLRSNQPEKALAALHPIQGADQIAPELYAVAGEVYLQNGDVKAAEAFFGKAAKLNPSDAGARTSLALTHLMSGEAPLAFGELQDIAANDKGTSADLALISIYMKQGDFDKALGAIDAYERKQPQQPLASNLRGRIQLARKDTGAARASFEHALALAPGYYPPVASLTALDLSAGKPEDARKRLIDFSNRNPGSAPALMALASLQGTAPDKAIAYLQQAIAANPSEATPRVRLIDVYLAGKNLRQATSTAQDAVASLPEEPDVIDALGRVQEASGDVNQAFTTYGKLIEMLPDSALPYIRLAEAQLRASNREAAAASLRKALAIKPDLIEVQRKLVLIDAVSGNLQDALAIARTVQRQRPTEAAGFALEGDVSTASRDWKGAVKAYRTGLEQAPSSELAVKLHSALTSSGDAAGADKFEAAWRKNHPDDGVFLFHLGDAALLRRDYATAESNYQAVIKLQPKNAAALNNLAWVTSFHDKDGALRYADAANRLAPDQPAFLDTWATILTEVKQYDKAIALQKKAIELVPSNADLQLNLAKIYVKSGNKADARLELTKLSGLGSKFPGQAEVSALLQSL